MEHVIFDSSQKLHKSGSDAGNYILLLGDQVLKQKPSYKYLGAYLDESLTFKEHAAKLYNKVYSQLSLLSRIRNNLTIYAAERVYKSMVLTKMEYSDFVWNNLAPSRLDKLVCLQIRAVKIELKDQVLLHEQLLQRLRWKTLDSRSIIHRLIFVLSVSMLKGQNFFKITIALPITVVPLV